MADYHYFIDNPEKLMRRVDATIKALDKYFPRAETLIVCGMSGMAVAAPIVYARRLGLAVIRKAGDQAYSLIDSWPAGEVGECVMLDDVVHCGVTVLRMLDRSIVHPVGLILYERLPGFTSSNQREICVEALLPVWPIASGVWSVLPKEV